MVTGSLVAFSMLIYFLFASGIPRTDFWINLTLYTLLFVTYLFFNKQNLNWKVVLGIGVSFRVIFLCTLPELSDDFYRFYWDGLQSVNGISPFAYLPSEISDEFLKPVYDKLNSPNYYSVYPGVNQLIFSFGVLLSSSLDGFVVVLKVLMLLTELLSFFFLFKLLKFKGQPLSLLAWYFLNPLVILEFVGNLHFEGFMLCAFLGSLYFLSQDKILASSLFLGVSCAVKIVPFLFVPLFLSKIKRGKYWLFLVVPPVVFVVTLLPFYHKDMLSHINESIQLYFGEFEFNSSFYLLISWLAIPKIILKVTLMSFLGMISLLLYRKNISLELALVWLFTCYLLLSQSIHPWYVAGFLGLAVLEKQRYVVLWTFLIFLTYITYQSVDYQQQLWVNIFEYLLVIAWFLKHIRVIILRNSY